MAKGVKYKIEMFEPFMPFSGYRNNSICILCNHGLFMLQKTILHNA